MNLWAWFAGVFAGNAAELLLDMYTDVASPPLVLKIMAVSMCGLAAVFWAKAIGVRP